MACSRCHTCETSIARVLNNIEYCPQCRQYQRPPAHGYDNPAPTEPEQAPCATEPPDHISHNAEQHPFAHAEILHTYTRAEAIADGTLVDIPQTIRAEFGIRFPIALTRAVWNEYVHVPEELTGLQDESSRLADILVMFHHAAKHAPPDVERITFQVVVRQTRQENLPPPITLKAIIDAGDDGNGAITILLPHED